jgi:hypothetical protein
MINNMNRKYKFTSVCSLNSQILNTSQRIYLKPTAMGAILVLYNWDYTPRSSFRYFLAIFSYFFLCFHAHKTCWQTLAGIPKKWKNMRKRAPSTINNFSNNSLTLYWKMSQTCIGHTALVLKSVYMPNHYIINVRHLLRYELINTVPTFTGVYSHFVGCNNKFRNICIPQSALARMHSIILVIFWQN